MDNDYTQITWQDVRKGDVLFHANGDRLTVSAVSHGGYQMCKSTAGSYHSVSTLTDAGFTPYRRQPEMPTDPGAYHDKDGGVVVLKIVEGVLWWHDGTFWHSEADMEHRAPFTRLVPMPSSDAVLEAVQRAEPMCKREQITDAVMALLRGDR